jgi:hypothetical protein
VLILAIGWGVIGLYALACIWIGLDAYTGGKLTRWRQR